MLRSRPLLWLLPALVAAFLHTAAAGSQGCSSRASPPVRIAVIDSGADVNHPDLSPYIARDSTGAVTGYDFVSESATMLDEYGHGTHVASLISAALSEACISHELMPLRILDRSGRGSRVALARAVQYAWDRVPYWWRPQGIRAGCRDLPRWVPSCAGRGRGRPVIRRQLGPDQR